MTRRKAAQLALRVSVLSAIACAFGGLSTYIMRVSEAQPVDNMQTVNPLDLQVSNSAAKSDRLSPTTPVRLASAESKPYTLASVTATPEIDLPAAAPARAEPPQIAAPAPQAAAPVPARKPKLPPPPAQPQTSSFLDDEQIAGLRSRLRLTSDQVEYWPAVEAALRDVVRTQLRASRSRNGKTDIDVNSPEVQKLIYSAMPLLFRLREEQKHEVRKLARIIGLESVASQI